MVKRTNTKAASRAPLRALPEEALLRATAGNSPSIDVETQKAVVWMREIVHIQ